MSLTRTVEGRYDLYLVKVDPEAILISPALQKMSDLTVWSTMWESSKFTDEAVEGFDKGKIFELANKFDVVLGYDDNTVSALRPYISGPRLSKLIGGYDSDQWLIESRPSDIPARDWSAEPFRFGMLGN